LAVRENSAARPKPPQDIDRKFVQPENAISFYGDFTQVLSTAEEVIFSMYETIPGVPGADGKVQGAITRLRATIVMSHGAAARLAEIVQQAVKGGQGSR
jgi:hypothetical protein